MRNFIPGVLVGILAGGFLVAILGRGAEEKPAGNEDATYDRQPLREWLGQLQRSDPLYRQQAVTALQDIGARDQAITDALLRAARDEDPDVRILALNALGTLTPRIAAVTPVLIEALRD